MKGKAMANIFNFLIPLALGIIAAIITYAGLTGKELPMISGAHGTLIALLVVGMAMCAFGILQVTARGRWVSPLAITGYILGIAILVVMVSTFSGWKLPLIHSETQAVVTVAVLMAVKYLIGTASFFLHLL